MYATTDKLNLTATRTKDSTALLTRDISHGSKYKMQGMLYAPYLLVIPIYHPHPLVLVLAEQTFLEIRQRLCQPLAHNPRLALHAPCEPQRRNSDLETGPNPLPLHLG